MSTPEFPPLEDVQMDRDSILDRVWVHLNTLASNPDTVLYFYCALEMRFFIESLFFELLAHYKNGEFSSRDLKTYRPRDFDALIPRLEPEYLSEAGEVLGISASADDLARVSRLYGRLSACLHLPKEPILTEDQERWKLEPEALVIHAFHYLDAFTRDPWRSSSASGAES